jgi:hypothetical protein
MVDDGVALTNDDALELLAFLLASAHGCLYDPPGYGVYRLATAAERLSAAWAPRASDQFARHLRELAQEIAGHVWDPMGRSRETEAFLDRVVADLARLAKDAGRQDG